MAVVRDLVNKVHHELLVLDWRHKQAVTAPFAPTVAVAVAPPRATRARRGHDGW
jgi:hypothetical protein